MKTALPRPFGKSTIFNMKKVILFAALATLCSYFGCSKADKSEPTPATPNTEVSKHTNTGSGGNMEVTSRYDCEDHECECDCCCDLKLIGPINQDVIIDICGPEIGCPEGTPPCNYGGGCTVNFTPGYGGPVTLNTSTTNNHKSFCSGTTGDLISVRNPSMVFTVRFTIECAGGLPSSTITLLPGEAAIITKGTGCVPNTPCIF